MTEKPRRSRPRKSESDTGSEPSRTGPTGSETDTFDNFSEEELQRRKFGWREGDVEIIYDPYTEERSKRRQQP